MYQPDLDTWAFLWTAGLWLTAGLVLVTAAARQRSAPDFLLALAFLVGGLLIGLQSAPNAGQGPFPFAAIALSVAGFWAFGGRQVDEATGLQPGDQWIKAGAMVAVGVLLYCVGMFFGPQPVLYLGLPLRPLELLVGAGVSYLWWCSRRLPDEFLTCMKRRDAQSLLWAVAGACLARLLGARYGDLCSCILLSLGVLPFLSRTIPQHGVGTAVRAGVATCTVLAMLGWTRGHHLLARQVAVQQASRIVGELTQDYEALQRPLDEAVEQRVAEEPRRRYALQQAKVRATATALESRFPSGIPAQFEADVRKLRIVLEDHARWGKTTLDAIAAWRMALGDSEERQKQEARASSARREAWLVIERGREVLRAIQDSVVQAGLGLVADTREMKHTVLMLLAAIALLTGALLPYHRTSRRAVSMEVAPIEPEWEVATEEDEETHWSGRVLVVDPDPKHRSVMRNMLEPTGVTVHEAGDEGDALAQMQRGGFDLVLLDAQTPHLDVARATAALRERGDYTPVVAMAAGGVDHQSLRDAGCSDVLPLHAQPEDVDWTLGRFLISDDQA